MTRETQVGMLVSGTFVCLVGTVLYIKLNDLDAPAARASEETREMPAFSAAVAGAPPSPEPVAAVRGTEPPTMSIPRTPAPAILQVKAVEPALLPKPLDAAPTPAPTDGRENTTPPPIGGAATLPADKPPLVPPTPAAAVPVEPKPEVVADARVPESVRPSHDTPPPTEVVAPVAKPDPTPAPEIPAPPATTDPALEPRRDLGPAGAGAIPAPGNPPIPAAPDIGAAPAAAKPDESTLIGADRKLRLPEPPPAAVTPAPADPAAAPTGRELTPPPPPPPAAPITHEAAPVVVAPAAPVETTPKPPPSAEPVQVASITPPPAPAAPPEPVAPATPVAPAPSTTSASATDAAHTAIAPPEPHATNVQIAPAPVPPLGADPKIMSPALPLPGASVVHAPTPVQPQVIAFDEENYRANAGDTFQSISDKFYHSQAYDRALLLFNRDHPAATGDLAADATAPRPGQTVYIPPLSILEDRYPQTLPNLPPLPRPHPTGAAKPAATVASYAATFRVPDGGLSFYQASQQALGSGDRWSEIYHLNPNYDPRVPLPAGAVLRLPPPSAGR